MSISNGPQSTNTTVLHKTLSNGCECYLEQVDFAPLVSMQMWVKTGSLDENPHEFGMAHVLEHMLFKGTERFPKTGEIAQRVESAGGDINAYTTFDHTVYYINAPREFAFQGAELLFDVVGSSLLDEEELNRELEVVVEEIRRSRDNPSARLSHTLFNKIFDGHPMSRPVIGYEDVVKSFNRRNLMAFYKNWYVPNNMTFVVAGDFPLVDMEQQLEKLSSRLQKAKLPNRVWSVNHPQPKPSAPECTLIYGPYQETRLQFTVPAAPCLEDETTPAWDMFASILGHGDSSRLSHTIKDEAQLVTAIDSSLYTPRFAYGFAGFGFYARSETTLEAITASIFEIARLAKEGPNHAELQRVLTAAKAERIYSRESIEGLVRTVGGNLMTNAKLAFDDRYLAALRKITVEQVQECAVAVCRQIVAGQVICVAASNEEHAATINEANLKSTIENAARRVDTYLNSRNGRLTDTSPALTPKRETSIRNPNVVHHTLNLSPNVEMSFNTRISNRLPVTSQVLVWRWGQHEEPLDKAGLNSIVAQMLTRGTAHQSYRSFVTELEDMGASISAFSGRDLFGLRLDALSEVQPRALKMLLDCLTCPALASEQLQRILRETEEVLVAQKDSPGSRLSRLSGPLYFGNHHYARPALGTLESLANITLEDVQQQWQRLLLANRFVLSGAGNFDSEATFEMVATELQQIAQTRDERLAALGALVPATVASAPARDPGIGYDELNREQAHISLGVRGYTLADKQRTALEVACAILGGQGGRLFMDLRDAQSLAYSVGCSQSPGLLGGTFTAYIGTAAAKSRQALAGLKAHLEKIAVELPSNEELMRAKNSLLGAQSLDSQHHHYQATQLSMSDIYGLGYDNFLGFRDRIEAVTAEDVCDSVRQLLKSQAPRIAVVGPANTWVPQADDELCRWNLAAN
ncbi:MAG: M16 family metallopeptidase [Silvanigrellaceae bacterium]